MVVCVVCVVWFCGWSCEDVVVVVLCDCGCDIAGLCVVVVVVLWSCAKTHKLSAKAKIAAVSVTASFLENIFHLKYRDKRFQKPFAQKRRCCWDAILRHI